MKYEVRDSKTLSELIAESGNSVNSFAKKMGASNSYLQMVIDKEQPVFPPYAKRVIKTLDSEGILNSKGEKLSIPDIFFEYVVAKKKQKEKVM